MGIERLLAALLAGCVLCAQAQIPSSMEALRAAERVDWEAVRLMSEERVEEALPLLHNAADLWQAAVGRQSRQVYRALGNLQTAYFRLQRYEEMAAVMEQRLAVACELFGERHDQVMVSARNLSDAYRALGRPAEAKAVTCRAAG